jgi:hypothetical protein
MENLITDIDISQISTKVRKPKPKKSSNGVRYNSEVGIIAGLVNTDSISYNSINEVIPPNRVSEPNKFYGDCKKLLEPSYDEKLFNEWKELGNEYKKQLLDYVDIDSIKFSWSGGKNISDDGPSDVGFLDSQYGGISVKTDGGITLSNLTPKHLLGIDVQKGMDIFCVVSPNDFISSKKNIFNEVMDIAQYSGEPIAPLDEKYYIEYCGNSIFKCVGKRKTVLLSRQEILDSVHRNSPWQRPFGDWYQSNFETKRHHTDELFKKISESFEEQIKKSLLDNEILSRVLRLSDKPYFYATPKSLYLVPDKSICHELEVKKVEYANPIGTSQLFKIFIGKRNSTISAVVDCYVRYANGLWACNPTVRIQSLRDQQNIGWLQIAYQRRNQSELS